MKTRYAHLAALAPTAAILALVVGGCSVLPPPLPPDNIYLLEAGTATVTAPLKRDTVLAVGQPRARAGFDTARMIWVRQAHGLEAYARNRWADTPSRMLEPLIRQALQRSGGFRAVVPHGVAAGLRLDTELVRLQQDFSARPSAVRITLRVQLIDTRARRVLASTELDEVEAATTDDPYGGVIAANLALARVLERVASFCAETTATQDKR